MKCKTNYDFDTSMEERGRKKYRQRRKKNWDQIISKYFC